MVCLLKGRGEGERERANEGRKGGREGGGQQQRETQRGEERESREENFSLLSRHGGSACVCACWSGDHAGKKNNPTHTHTQHTLAN